MDLIPLRDDVICPICMAPVIAVLRTWGPLTRFDYVHRDPPHVLHSTMMFRAKAEGIAKAESPEQLIVRPPGICADQTLVPVPELSTKGSDVDEDS